MIGTLLGGIVGISIGVLILFVYYFFYVIHTTKRNRKLIKDVTDSAAQFQKEIEATLDHPCMEIPSVEVVTLILTDELNTCFITKCW